MKVLLTLALLLAPLHAQAPATPIIVVLKDQADPGTIHAPGKHQRRAAIERALRAKAATTQQPLLTLLKDAEDVRPLWIVNAIALTATPALIDRLAARPDVREIRKDGTFRAPALTTATATAEPNIALTGAPALWDLGLRGQGVVVAALDTGVDATHPDLAGRYRGGTNSWYDPNGEHPAPADVNGHGTSVMGVIAGANGLGMAPQATWIAAKIFNDRGAATASGIHLAMQWLLDPDGDPGTSDAPDVVNNSWTGASGGCLPDFQPDLRTLRLAGIVPVFAAGNFGPTPGSVYSPANLQEAFAVGATDDADVLAADSGRGASACAGATAPALVAPGVNIRTADLYGLYTTASGTSLAAPHVTGALALLLGAYPDLDAARQQAALQHGALDLGAPGIDPDHGYGRLDVLAARDWLASTPDFTLSAAPATRTSPTGGSAAYTVTTTPMNGFTAPITLTVTGTPAGATATWTGTTLTLATPTGTAPGAYPLTITGTSGTLTHSTSVTLIVTQGDYTLSAAPATLTVTRGGSASAMISTSGTYAGAVTLAATGLPSATTATFALNPLNVPGTAKLTLKTTSATARGTFTVRVTGTSGPLTHQTMLTFTVR
jgi:subtilisin family serine protease